MSVSGKRIAALCALAGAGVAAGTGVASAAEQAPAQGGPSIGAPTFPIAVNVDVPVGASKTGGKQQGNLGPAAPQTEAPNSGVSLEQSAPGMPAPPPAPMPTPEQDGGQQGPQFPGKSVAAGPDVLSAAGEAVPVVGGAGGVAPTGASPVGGLLGGLPVVG